MKKKPVSAIPGPTPGAVELSKVIFGDFTFFQRDQKREAETSEEFLKRIGVPEEMEALKRIGVQHTPCQLRETASGMYQIICGWRRALACRMLDWPIQALVYPATLSDTKADEIAWSENEDRIGLTGFEQLLRFHRLRESGMAPKEIASHLGMRHSNDVHNALRVFKFPALVAALRDGLDLSRSRAETLATALSAMCNKTEMDPSDPRITQFMCAVAEGDYKENKLGVSMFFANDREDATVPPPKMKHSKPFSYKWTPKTTPDRLWKLHGWHKDEIKAIEKTLSTMGKTKGGK